MKTITQIYNKLKEVWCRIVGIEETIAEIKADCCKDGFNCNDITIEGCQVNVPDNTGIPNLKDAITVVHDPATCSWNICLDPVFVEVITANPIIPTIVSPDGSVNITFDYNKWLLSVPNPCEEIEILGCKDENGKDIVIIEKQPGTCNFGICLDNRLIHLANHAIVQNGKISDLQNDAGYVTADNIPVPNLQQVTDVGNVTTKNLVVQDSNSEYSVYLKAESIRSTVGFNKIGTSQRGFINFITDHSDLGDYLELTVNGHSHFKLGKNSTDYSMFWTTVQGYPATKNNEFVTLSQIQQLLTDDLLFDDDNNEIIDPVSDDLRTQFKANLNAHTPKVYSYTRTYNTTPPSSEILFDDLQKPLDTIFSFQQDGCILQIKCNANIASFKAVLRSHSNPTNEYVTWEISNVIAGNTSVVQGLIRKDLNLAKFDDVELFFYTDVQAISNISISLNYNLVELVF